MRLAATAPVLALLLALPARAAELSLQEIAVAEREERAALEKVNAAHGHKPPQELSAEERSQIIREHQAASRAVFEQRSIDPKAFALRVMRLTPAERAQVEAEKQRMDKEEADRRAREAEEKARADAQEPEVILGIDERRPVDVYLDPDAVPVESLQAEGEAAEPPPEAPAKPARPPQKTPRGGKSRNK